MSQIDRCKSRKLKVDTAVETAAELVDFLALSIEELEEQSANLGNVEAELECVKMLGAITGEGSEETGIHQLFEEIFTRLGWIEQTLNGLSSK